MAMNDNSRELLYGVSHALGLVDQSTLLRALNAWKSASGRPFARVLAERGAAEGGQGRLDRSRVLRRLEEPRRRRP